MRVISWSSLNPTVMVRWVRFLQQCVPSMPGVSVSAQMGRHCAIFVQLVGLVAASTAWAPPTSVTASTWVSARKQNRRQDTRIDYILTSVPFDAVQSAGVDEDTHLATADLHDDCMVYSVIHIVAPRPRNALHTKAKVFSAQRALDTSTHEHAQSFAHSLLPFLLQSLQRPRDTDHMDRLIVDALRSVQDKCFSIGQQSRPRETVDLSGNHDPVLSNCNRAPSTSSISHWCLVVPRSCRFRSLCGLRAHGPPYIARRAAAALFRLQTHQCIVRVSVQQQHCDMVSRVI